MMHKFSAFTATLDALRAARSTNEKCAILRDRLARLDDEHPSSAAATATDLQSAWRTLLLRPFPVRVTTKQLRRLVDVLLVPNRRRSTATDTAATTATEPVDASVDAALDSLARAVCESRQFALFADADPDVVTVHDLLVRQFAATRKLYTRTACLATLFSLCGPDAVRHVLAVVSGQVRRTVGGSTIVDRVLRDIQPEMDAPLDAPAPVAPMLARPVASLADVADWRAHTTQLKYDGERVQVVKCAERVRLYSRLLREMPADRVAGLDSVLRAGVLADTCTLDGELVSVLDDRVLPFGSLGVHRRRQLGGVLRYVAFDCLFRDGQDLRRRPLSERTDALRQVVAEGPQLRVARSLDDEAQDAASVVELVDRLVVGGRHEGLVVKRLDEPYVSNARRWIKIKTDHLAGYASTVDLAVVGADFGSNSNAARYASLYLAAALQEGGGGGGYRVVAKVANGLSRDQLDWLTGSGRFCATGGDPTVDFGTYQRAAHVVGDVQRDALVVEVKYATVTDRLSLRFPRVVRTRDDKAVRDVDTMATLEARRHANGKDAFCTTTTTTTVTSDSPHDAEGQAKKCRYS